MNSDDDDDTVDDPDFLPPNVTNGEPNNDLADEETLEDSTQNENPDIEYLWSESQQPKVIPNFDSAGKPTHQGFTRLSQPIDYFNRYFDSEIIKKIVDETNLYAEQKNEKNWTPLTQEELQAFLGILIMMGINKLPTLELYWSSDPFFNNQEISSIMPVKRFKKIISNLHANDNQKAVPRNEPGFDKLYKVRPLITHFEKKFQEEYSNSSVQSIDEIMVKFKGRSTMKQYMPGKPVKRGYKIWARSDASSGYLYQFEIYTGKKDDGAISEGLGYRVVTNLTNDLHPTSPLLVVFDNFFTSVPLMETLLSKNIYAIGTIRTDRKFLPEPMKKKRNYQKNESLMLACRDIVAVQWRDTKVVTLLSTAHNMNEMTEVNRTQKDGSKKKVACPKAIADYTRSMGGVDKFNHLKSSYSSSRRSKKWWHRLFYFLLDASLVNSYILYVDNHNVARNSHLEIRLRIARGLIGGFCSKKRKLQSSWVARKKENRIPQEIRTTNVGTHMPEKGETYRRCKHCSTKTNQKRTKVLCSTCNVPLCAAPCFMLFHQNN